MGRRTASGMSRIEINPEFHKQLQGLSDPEIEKLAEKVAAHARDIAPKGKTGNLHKGIKVKEKQAGKEGIRLVVSDAPHTAIVHEGTKERYTKSGAYRGMMTAFRFMHLALERSGIK